MNKLKGKPDFSNPIHDKDFCNQNQMQGKCENYMILLQNFQGLMELNNENIDRIERLMDENQRLLNVMKR
ncbi:MAG: hypothetical protein ACUZ8I_15020 [Candidatus Scalindua sp.]